MRGGFGAALPLVGLPGRKNGSRFTTCRAISLLRVLFSIRGAFSAETVNQHSAHSVSHDEYSRLSQFVSTVELSRP